MEIVLKIDNPDFEKQLIEFVKHQKQGLEEITLEALKKFLDSFHQKEPLQYKKKDIRKHLSVIKIDDDEPRDESVELYTHVEDSAKYIHDLRRMRNR